MHVIAPMERKPASDPSSSHAHDAARAERHASRAARTYHRFVRAIADAGGYATEDADEYAVAVIATLEEKLPLVAVHHLEAQLPRTLDEKLAYEPLLDLPGMDKAEFCARVATRLAITLPEAERVARVVLGVVRSLISEGEAQHVEWLLSPDVRKLWTSH
jgi:uncharacterized protein (DUF2267 family)